MKLLLDENLPEPLRHFFLEHEVATVGFMKWKGVRNGDLLRTAAGRGFEVITVDARMMDARQDERISILVLRVFDNTLETLRPMLPRLLSLLLRVSPGSVHVIPLREPG